MKDYKYERYTIRLNDEMKMYLKSISARRGVSQTAMIKFIIGEYKEGNRNGR